VPLTSFTSRQSFLPRSGVLALGPAFDKHPLSFVSSPLHHLFIRFLTLVRSLLHQQLTFSHSLLASPNMRIKKLTAIGIMPFGAATVLTTAGTSPYSNASMLGTAATNPYVYISHRSYLFCPLASLPFHHTSHQHLGAKEPVSDLERTCLPHSSA
jgi:hypothetical protein